jgi:TRAP-type C4-dicarboxylate transport system substrate-binding protein
MLTKTNFIIKVFFILLFSSQYTSAKTLHWGINLEPLEYFEIAALRFKKNVEIRTNNEVKVKLTIGKYKQEDRNHFEDVRQGIYDMGQEVVGNLIKHEERLSIWQIPFLFNNDQHVLEYISSTPAANSLNSLKKLGVYPFGFTYSGGFIHLIGDRLVKIQGLERTHMRIEQGSSNYKHNMLSSLKLSGIELNDGFKEDKSDVRNSYELISSVLEELYEQKSTRKRYLNATGHRVYLRALFINNNFLKSLSKRNRDIVIEEGKKAADFERRLSIEATKNHLFNIKHNYPQIEIVRFSGKRRLEMRKPFKAFYSQYRKKFGNDDLLFIDNLQSSLAK